MSSTFSLLDILHNPLHQFATKVASPAPHCEGPPDLLVYPQPAKIVLLFQVLIPLSRRLSSSRLILGIRNCKQFLKT